MGALVLAVFVVVSLAGLYLGELRWTHVVGVTAAAIAGLVAIAWIGWPAILFWGFLALLDVGLILVVFKGDISIR